MADSDPTLEQLNRLSGVIDKLLRRRIIASIVILILAYLYGVLVVRFLGEAIFPYLGYDRKLTWQVCLAPYPIAWILWGIAVVECTELLAKDYSFLKASFHPLLLLRNFLTWAILPAALIFVAALLLSLLFIGMLERFLQYAVYGALAYLVFRYGLLSIPRTYQFLSLSHWREWLRWKKKAAPEPSRHIRGTEIEEVLRITEETEFGNVYTPYH